MRHRRVSARALDGNIQDVRRRQQWSASPAKHTARGVGHDVQGKGGIGQRINQAVVEHEACAMMAFFAGLEHELDGARQLVALGT